MRNVRAFSLVELLLAMALIAILSGSIFGFLWNVMHQRDVLVHATADSLSAGAFFELLESDLACAVAGDAVLGAGVSGDEASLRVLSRRVWVPASGRERDAAMGDLQFSEYVFDGSAGVLRVQRRSMRGHGEEEGGTTTSAEPIADRLEGLRIRYFDGQSWVNSFDSLQREGLPVAIEVAIWQRRSGSRGSSEEIQADDPWDDDEVQIPQRSPDRLRIIGIADGPTMSWKEGS